MINIITKDYLKLLVITVMMVACAKESLHGEPTGITMTTKASSLFFYVTGAEDILIYWGDGKVSNVKEAF